MLSSQNKLPPEDKTLVCYYKKLHEESKASKEEKKPAVAKDAKTTEFRLWGKLNVRLQKLTEEFLYHEELIALSQTATAHRQSSKAILLKRHFPVDFARVERTKTPDQKTHYAQAFKAACQRDVVNTKEWKEGKSVPHKSNARHERLLLLCKEGRLAELKNEKLTIIDFYNICDGQSFTLRYWAAKNHHPRLLNYLYGEILKLFPEEADIHHRLLEFNKTLLHLAADLNQLAVVKTLLACDSITIDARDSDNRTPLYLAAWMGHFEIAQLLLDHKADPNATNSRDQTLLIVAAIGGHLQVAELLLKHRAKINGTNKQGTTALNNAAYFGHYDVVTFLLQHNADITLRDHGKTAFEWATDPTIKIPLLIAEIELFINENRPAKPGLFGDSLNPLQQLKIALEKKDFARIENLKIPNQGTPGQIYQKALQIVELMKPKPEPIKKHHAKCVVM
jgi:hypothetical protein